METIAVGFGAIPFLSGRTTLAIGLIITFYTFRVMWEMKEVSPRTVLLGIAVGLGSILLQYCIHWVRETVASLEATVREWMRHLDTLAATCFALLFGVALLGYFGEMAALGVRGAVSHTGLEKTVSLFQAAVILGLLGGTAYAFAWLRGWLTELFTIVPLSDEPSVRRVVFAADVGWTVIGVFVAVMFPVVGLVVMVLSFLVLLGVALALRAMARTAYGRCEHCAAELHLAASVCPSCASARVPRRIGLFARVLEGAPADLAEHRHALLAARRCPSCAERLKADGQGPCSRCGVVAFRDEEARRAFLRFVEARLAALLPVFALFGLLPVLGIGAAFLLYKLSPAGALGGYTRLRDRLGMGFLKVVAVLGLVFLQPVPLVGALAVPAVIGLLHVSSRQAFLAGASSAVADAPAGAQAEAVPKLTA